jgi:hypothetical protein
LYEIEMAGKQEHPKLSREEMARKLNLKPLNFDKRLNRARTTLAGFLLETMVFECEEGSEQEEFECLYPEYAKYLRQGKC